MRTQRRQLLFGSELKNIIHSIYILQLQQPVHRLKMEISVSQCTNETSQTTMNTTVTTTF